MTGNHGQLVFGPADLPRGTEDIGLRNRIHKSYWPVLAFACSATCGALICRRISQPASALLAIPCGPTLESPARY